MNYIFASIVIVCISCLIGLGIYLAHKEQLEKLKSKK